MTEPSVRSGTTRVAVLGPVLVTTPSGEPIEPGGATAKSLVAALVLAHGPLSVRGIVDDLWQDAPPRNEKAALQTLVSRVRAVAADGLIVSTPGGYSLGIEAHQCDLGAAVAHREAARAALERGDAQGADAEASAGLALWRGEPGVDLGDTELAERLASAAFELHRDLALQRAKARVETGDTFGALSDLAPLAEAAPLDEEIELLRLRAIAGGGRRNDAIREFGEFRQRMRDRLGTDPSAELVAFNAQLLRAPEPDAAPPRTLLVGIRTAPNELVGRSADIESVEQLTRASRLTTILGAGGLGKTRLAQEIAARAAERMPGVVVVELASVRTGDDVPLALASTLGIREYSGTRLSLSDPAVRVDVRGRILGALAERPTLLVMDNCEHLIDAAAEWIADILGSTRDVRVLATSRAPLMISAEQVYQLEPLASLAGDDSGPGPAVTLFMERARAARPSVVLPVDTIERLCESLDGLPLAIELAAARVRSMSVEEIERRIVNRFALLRGGDRAAPERHRTLLAVIDWSWNLLTDSEQRALSRLSVFVDGFSAEAAVAVTDPGADGEADLEGLVNQSLLSATESKVTGQVRYRMLETVREFGDKRLQDAGERDEVEARIRSWADVFCLDALDSTYGPAQLETFHRVQEEQDNLVSALRNAIETDDSATAASVYAALGMHWTVRGAHSEVLSLAPQVLGTLVGYDPDDRHVDVAMIALGLIGGTSLITDMRQGLRALVRVRKLHERGGPRNPQLDAMVSVLLSMPDLKAAFATVERLRASDDPAVASFAYLISSQMAENSGEIDTGLKYAKLAYAKAQAAEDAWTVGTSAHTIAQFNSERGDAEQVLEWAARARPNLAALSAGEDLRQLDWLIAISEVSLGRLDAAQPTFERMTRLQGDTDSYDWNDLRAIGFAGLAEIAGRRGDLFETERQYALAEQVWGDPPAGFAPWYYGAAAGLLVASVRAGHVADPRNLRVVRRVRSRLMRDHRVRTGMVDMPITGVAAIGLGVWLLAPGREAADAAQLESGLELLVLGKAIAARQDFRSLGWQRALDEAEHDHPQLDIPATMSRVDALPRPQRVERLNEVVRSLRSLVL
ncbi:BTAD domain-containing putative transcriptional regulator [Humibacter sp. RRB41]|uniref:ATP-binding protein n=1 Tax=Humibacter sp. RRB41 TaxID=2919946 RepID=UPI001FAAE35F|nr:BTAD domain-containing putative transcriptional regulator [Humibacter sp. RRB41]